MKTETTIQANPKIQQSEKSQFRQYASYKPSNVEWLGDVPSHWKVDRIKDIFIDNSTNINIDVLKKVERVAHYSIPAFDNGKQPEIVNGEEIDSNKTLLIGNQILFSRLNSHKPRVWLIDEDDEFKVCSTEFFVHRNEDKKANLKFFEYLLTDDGFIALAASFQSSVTNSHKRIAPKDYYNFGVPLPPFTEQTAIAAYLDQATANIDQVIATKQKQLEKLEQYKQSKIHECVTGKHRLNLDLQDEKIKGLKSKNPGIQNISIQTKDSGIDWIGDVPGHWRKIKLRYEIEIQSGEFVSNTELEVGGDFPVFGGNGIMGYVSKFNIESERLIIGRVGAKCGNVHHVENSAWISDNALIVTTYHNYRYLFYLLTEMNLNSISSQSAQPLITGTKIKNEYVVLPPIGEQIEIAEYLNDFSQKISKEKSIIEQQIEKLKQYRKCLIHECVTGKRKVINE